MPTHPQHSGRLGARLVKDVTEEEGDALAWRQDLRGGDERETHGLANGGHLCWVGALVKYQAVRKRLQPGNIAWRRGGGRVGIE